MIIMVSGGMDPIHVGHLDLLEHAAKYGEVVVALNSDAWLIRKKGYCFMPYQERARLVAAIHCVGGVVPVNDADGTVCEALRRIRPDFFANGGDRIAPSFAEHSVCSELGIKEVFGVGGGKVQSSSALVQATRKTA